MVQLLMGDKMAKMTDKEKQEQIEREITDQDAQSEYNQRVFGTAYPQKERIEASLNRAHEIRKFEIDLYWRRSLFFWGFTFAFLTVFALILGSENTKEVKPIAAILLSGMGAFTSFAWRYIEKGSSAWQKNWEQHIDFLEDNITGKLHKTVLGTSSKFYSISSIHAIFIYSMIIFWGGLFFLSICFFPLGVFYTLNCSMDVYSGIKECFPILLSHFRNYVFLYLTVIYTVVISGMEIYTIAIHRFFALKEKPFEHLGKWRSSERTIPRGIYSSDDNAMHKRNLPKMHKPLD